MKIIPSVDTLAYELFQAWYSWERDHSREHIPLWNDQPTEFRQIFIDAARKIIANK